MAFLFRPSSSPSAAPSRPVLDSTFRLSLNSNPGHLTEIFIEGLRWSPPPPSLPYCFELDRTTTGRDTAPRSSLRYLSSKLLPFLSSAIALVLALASSLIHFTEFVRYGLFTLLITFRFYLLNVHSLYD